MVVLSLGFGCAGSGVAPLLPADDDCAAGLRQTPVDGRGGNVLVLVADDLGVDKIAAYGEHPVPPTTPNLDALVASGVRFQQAFGYPVCSPGRAALLTGRSSVHTGIGTTVRPGDDGYVLQDDEITLPEMLGGSPVGPWLTAAVGKWHLSGFDDVAASAPLDQGFDRFLGLLGNVREAAHPDGAELDYFHWEKDTDGSLALVDDYAITTQTDDALALMRTLPEPWLLYVAYSGIHEPVHLPPPDLCPETVPDGTPGFVDAMVEALDTEIGRLLSEVDDHTTVIFAADNGTAPVGVRSPADPQRAKDTLYEGGVRVPLAVAGFAVDRPGTVVDALVHLVDVFPTVADLAGVQVSSLDRQIDGVSLLPWLSEPERPGRRCVVVDRFQENGDPAPSLDRSIRDAEWALIRRHDGPEELYRRFAGAPWESPDLLLEPLDADVEAAWERLSADLDREIW